MIVYIYNIGVDLYNGFNGLRHRINWTYFTVLDGLAHPLYSLKDFKLSISIGIAFAPKDGTTFMELYRHADQALYQTKRTGKNNYKIYKNDEN